MQPPDSYWTTTLDSSPARQPLGTDLDCDVVIIGAGFTGLWTAYELLRRDPTLRVAVIEKHAVGFGASGRNGGWVSALFPLDDESVERRHGREALEYQRSYLERSVPAFGRTLDEAGIGGDFVQGGTITFARSPLQAQRLRRDARGDSRWLNEEDLTSVARVSGASGGLFSPHCARIHPLKVVRGLAQSVERLGGTIYEDTAVTRLRPARGAQRAFVTTSHASVRADVVVRATEGFTSTLPGYRRAIAPIYSLMVATAPLTAAFWDEYGFQSMPTFSDDRNLIIYGQRTADNRLAFGGRGAPYHFGSTVEPSFDVNPAVFRALEATLHELFPTLDAPVTHRWGGPLGMPRDREPWVQVDHERGLASAGGYTGDGVTLSRVCATALADLILFPGVETDATRLPFVQRRVRRWEFEPARWLGINAGLALATYADSFEHRHQREGWPGRALHRLLR